MKKKSSIGLSKSKIIQGLQCPKALYFSKHQPELGTPVSSSQQALFDMGHAVGAEARTRYSGGVLIEAERQEGTKALKLTEEAIKNGALVLFEAAFAYENVLVRLDVLKRAKVGAPWHIIEVKSSTKVKDEHIQDAAIQAWVLRKAGLGVEKVSIQFINNKCVHPDLKNLFTKEDITGLLPPYIKKLPAVVRELTATLQAAKPPAIGIGAHCSEPYKCDYKDHCWKKAKVPEISVLDIPRMNSAEKWELFNEGYITPAQVLAGMREQGRSLNATQTQMLSVSMTGKRFVDAEYLEQALKKWKYPLRFFDFETFNPAIPRFSGTRPYQMLTFQFSCDLVTTPGAKHQHFEYLHEDNTDPREPLILALLKVIGTEGSVVAYNMTFEATRLRELAAEFPRYSKQLLAIVARLVDPLPAIRAAVYDKHFYGSFSLKEVAPALLGATASYEGMQVAEGSSASIAFEDMISEGTKPARKKALRGALLAYCANDTYVLVELVNWFRKIIVRNSQVGSD